MDDNEPTTADLLEAWREATRAAELAERLTAMAGETAKRAEDNALAYERIAVMAEKASKAAERAARSAGDAAKEARERATEYRDVGVSTVTATRDAARQVEIEARDRYHESEDAARKRQGL